MNLQELQTDPAKFREHLKIDADGRAVYLTKKLDPWQKRDFLMLDEGWQAVAGQNEECSILRAWLERPRGHSKTCDLAVMATWVLFASKRSISGYGAAADKDQAKLLKDSIERIIRINPWLNRILAIQTNRIINKHTGSSLEIISSDAPTSYGLTPDFIIVDEITHWKKDDLWTALFSAAAKRLNCMTVVITNAGFSESWQAELRSAVQDDDGWYFSRLDGPKASWITPDRLNEQRRLLPEISFRRLWLNEWTEGSGDALSADDIQNSVRLPGPLPEAEPGWIYVAGVDLGLSRDCSAVVVIGKHIGKAETHRRPKRLTRTQRIRIDAGIAEEPEDEYFEQVEQATGKIKLAQVKIWRPENGRRVSVDAVEKMILRLNERFKLSCVGFDPWQAAMLQERISRTMQTELVGFTGPNLQSMCSAVLESFSEGMISIYEHPQLLSDLKNLRVVEKSYGVRLDSPRGGTISGHGDAATALAISLHILKSSHNGIDQLRRQDVLLCS